MLDAPIDFEKHPAKTLEALVYVAHRRHDLPFWRILKILFYADKRHLVRYGRPVTGDDHIAMRDGPVPSLAYDLLKLESFLPDELLDAAVQALDTRARQGTEWSSVRAKRAPNLDLLSPSDRECLDWSADTIGPMDYQKLWDMSHRERAYKATSRNGRMPVELLIGEDVPDREDLIEQLRETASRIVL